jgi:uncharacterized protein (DUF58 family)
MSWLELFIIVILIIALIAAMLYWEMRSFGFAIIFGLLFVLGVFVLMQGTIGDQIRKEVSEQKAAVSQVKRSG